MVKKEVAQILEKVAANFGEEISKKDVVNFFIEAQKELLRTAYKEDKKIPFLNFGFLGVVKVPSRKIKTPIMEKFKRTSEGLKIKFQQTKKSKDLKGLLNDY